MKYILSCLGLFLLLSLSAYSQESSDDFNQLVDWITGDYTAAATAEMDSPGDLALHIRQIWPDSPTGAWLYVEELKAGNENSPSRQEVYFLSEISDGEYSLDIYKIPADSAFVGAWKNPSKFDGMTAFDLKNQNGCALFLNYDGFQYSGKTNSGSCKAQSDDYEYTTRNIILLPNEYQVWNREFDKDGKQVSGAKKDPIKFIKKG